MPEAKKQVTALTVLLYVPNLIGYFRCVLLVVGALFLKSNPIVWMSCYFVSFVLDGLDGMAARYLGQCSDFGAFLDMITDRIATLFLTVLLVDLDVNEKYFLLGWILIDIFSHWCRVYTSSKMDMHHKNKKGMFWL